MKHFKKSIRIRKTIQRRKTYKGGNTIITQTITPKKTTINSTHLNFNPNIINPKKY